MPPSPGSPRWPVCTRRRARCFFTQRVAALKHLVVGPMAATAALSAAAVGDVAAGNSGAFAALTVTLALITGALPLVAGLLRLGFVANFISEPVLKGFIVGLALTVIIGQIPKLLGVTAAQAVLARAPANDQPLAEEE